MSTPVKRLRWATQRVAGIGGRRKRQNIADRSHKTFGANEKKRESGGTDSADGSHLGGVQEQARGTSEHGENEGIIRRRIFFNTPLPDNAKDEEGRPIFQFGRNKIRTAKYTPLSFVPKNLWFQFHNIANVYFLFLIILAVRINGR